MSEEIISDISGSDEFLDIPWKKNSALDNL